MIWSLNSKLDLNLSCAKDFRNLISMVTWCVGSNNFSAQFINTFATKHLKKPYPSVKHVSRSPEYWGYMSSTQSISRTIQPIAVKHSQHVANINKKFIWTNNKKDIHVWPLATILAAIL